ncbi:MAG: MotA/TolQ/ExbB proton channel family protein [Rhodothermales bacterium]
MEKSTVAGLGAGLLLVYGAIFMGTGWATFFDPASFMLVVGGAGAGMMVNYTFDQLKMMPGAFKDFFSFSLPPLSKYIEEFGELSRIARREGLLALDRRLEEIDDPFLKFGLEMAVDGIDEREIDEMMQANLQTELNEKSFAVKLFTSFGANAPAFGMIGTLIGLIQMMGNLSDPSQIGAGMAVALVTTFLGSLIANLFFLPFAEKRKLQVAALLRMRELVRTGVLAIVRGDSPSMIQKRLQNLLTPSELSQVATPAQAEEA